MCWRQKDEEVVEIINGHFSKHTGNGRKSVINNQKRGENCSLLNSEKLITFYNLYLIEGKDGSANLPGV